MKEWQNLLQHGMRCMKQKCQKIGIAMKEEDNQKKHRLIIIEPKRIERLRNSDVLELALVSYHDCYYCHHYYHYIIIITLVTNMLICYHLIIGWVLIIRYILESSWFRLHRVTKPLSWKIYPIISSFSSVSIFQKTRGKNTPKWCNYHLFRVVRRYLL